MSFDYANTPVAWRVKFGSTEVKGVVSVKPAARTGLGSFSQGDGLAKKVPMFTESDAIVEMVVQDIGWAYTNDGAAPAALNLYAIKNDGSLIAALQQTYPKAIPHVDPQSLTSLGGTQQVNVRFSVLPDDDGLVSDSAKPYAVPGYPAMP